MARIEDETGLSRGAIFNYFENKEALFVALVRPLVGLDSSRSGSRRVTGRCSRPIAHEDADWLSVQVEASRRVRTDEGFRAQIAKLDARTPRRSRPERVCTTRAERCETTCPSRLSPSSSACSRTASRFARVTGDPMPDLDDLMTLIETGIAPRSSP